MVVVALLVGACRPAPPPAVPVVLVSIDTLRADRLNAYGYRRRLTTPRLDALAADGIVFEQHVSSSPWTTPSHLSLFTSLHPTSHGVVTSFKDLMGGLGQLGKADRLAASIPTLPELLKAGGRATAAFTGGVTLDPAIGFGRGFDSYDVSLTKLSPRKMAPVLDWIRARRGTPYFLFLHTFEVHAPYLDTRFLEQAIEAERARRVRTLLNRIGKEKGGWKDLGEAKYALAQNDALHREAVDALYDGGVAATDEYLGHVLDVLRETGDYDRALVIVTSDHGETLGERGAYFYNNHGTSLHEEQVHVPLIVKLPGRAAAGTRVRALTRAIDVLPTVLDVVGTPAPAALQGRSLRARWEKKPQAVLPALMEALSDDESKGIRDERYKLVADVDPAYTQAHGRSALPEAFLARQLYDLASDPGEEHDLLKKAAPDAQRLAALMETQLRRELSARQGKAESVQLDAEASDRPRALGDVK